MSKDYKNLIQAFAQVNWQPPEQVYRIYYDDSGTIISKTTELLDGQHITVSKELYEQVYMHTHWRVNKGNVELRPVVQQARSMLKYDDKGPYRTTAETPIFLVDDSYSGPTTQWTF